MTDQLSINGPNKFGNMYSYTDWFPFYHLKQYMYTVKKYSFNVQLAKFKHMLITLAAWSKAWNVFSRWIIGIVGSNPTRGRDVCVPLFCVCVVLCVDSGLGTGWSPFKGVLPFVYGLTNSKRGQGQTNGCRAIDRQAGRQAGRRMDGWI
jgi:hypothetical protein